MMLFYRSMAGDTDYGGSLQRMVAIDWSFDPDDVHADARPITRPNGRRFRVVWEGREPNDIVRRYMQSRTQHEPDEER